MMGWEEGGYIGLDPRGGGWILWMLLVEVFKVSGTYQLVEAAVLKTAYSV